LCITHTPPSPPSLPPSLSSRLSKHGQSYAKQLATFAQERIMSDAETKQPRPARLWTSTMRRYVPYPSLPPSLPDSSKETAQYIRQQTIIVKSENF
jgi:hypothetical protein